MADLQLKLQMTATQAQNKTLDLELNQMKSEEHEQHLKIAEVQPLLPHCDPLRSLTWRSIFFPTHGKRNEIPSAHSLASSR